MQRHGELRSCTQDWFRQLCQGVPGCAHPDRPKGKTSRSDCRAVFQVLQFYLNTSRGQRVRIAFLSSLQVALKVIEKRAVSMNKKLLLRVRREISNLKKIQHDNVVQIYESKYHADHDRERQLLATRLATCIAPVETAI